MLLGALAAAIVLVPGWLWLRGSTLVAVDEVTVVGATGPQAAEVRAALTAAAEEMTTLAVDEQALRDAVRAYPVVAALRAEAHPLHRMTITVTERPPVAALANGDARLAVAADGTILPGARTEGLPLVPVGAPPGGRTLAEPKARAMVALLGAAPGPLRARVQEVSVGDAGLVARLSDGPELVFGQPTGLRLKWLAATRVLGDYASRGASYLDVRVPERPAAGGLEPVETQPEVETTQ